MRTFLVLFLAVLGGLVQSFVVPLAYGDEPIAAVTPTDSPEPTPAVAASSTPVELPSPSPIVEEKEVEDENLYKNLPEIEAKTYEIRTFRISKSNRVYLFDDLEKREPKVGRIILVRKEDQPVKAFRVLKIYPDRKQFAAKRVRVYGTDKPFELLTNFIAIEKIADVQEEALPPPPLTEDEKKELQEIEEDLPPPPDEEALSKMIKKKPPAEEEEDEDTEPSKLSMDDIVMKEIKHFDTLNHGFTVEFGFLKNISSGDQYTYFTGAGIRYALTLAHRIFIREARLQDSLVVEGGAFTYKALNYAETGDSYTIYSLLGTLRYTLNTSEDFAIFFHTGVLKNFAQATVNGASDYSVKLSSVIPAGGGGLLFRLGPGWFGRMDFGWEFLGLGIMLRL